MKIEKGLIRTSSDIRNLTSNILIYFVTHNLLNFQIVFKCELYLSLFTPSGVRFDLPGNQWETFWLVL